MNKDKITNINTINNNDINTNNILSTTAKIKLGIIYLIQCVVFKARNIINTTTDVFYKTLFDSNIFNINDNLYMYKSYNVYNPSYLILTNELKPINYYDNISQTNTDYFEDIKNIEITYSNESNIDNSININFKNLGFVYDKDIDFNIDNIIDKCVMHFVETTVSPISELTSLKYTITITEEDFDDDTFEYVEIESSDEILVK